MSDEVEKAKAAAGGEKVERTLFEKIIAREVSAENFSKSLTMQAELANEMIRNFQRHWKHLVGISKIVVEIQVLDPRETKIPK